MVCVDCTKNLVSTNHNCVRHSDCFSEDDVQWKPGNCETCQANLDLANEDVTYREKIIKLVRKMWAAAKLRGRKDDLLHPDQQRFKTRWLKKQLSNKKKNSSIDSLNAPSTSNSNLLSSPTVNNNIVSLNIISPTTSSANDTNLVTELKNELAAMKRQMEELKNPQVQNQSIGTKSPPQVFTPPNPLDSNIPLQNVEHPGSQTHGAILHMPNEQEIEHSIDEILASLHSDSQSGTQAYQITPMSEASINNSRELANTSDQVLDTSDQALNASEYHPFVWEAWPTCEPVFEPSQEMKEFLSTNPPLYKIPKEIEFAENHLKLDDNTIITSEDAFIGMINDIGVIVFRNKKPKFAEFCRLWTRLNPKPQQEGRMSANEKRQLVSRIIDWNEPKDWQYTQKDNVFSLTTPKTALPNLNSEELKNFKETSINKPWKLNSSDEEKQKFLEYINGNALDSNSYKIDRLFQNITSPVDQKLLQADHRSRNRAAEVLSVFSTQSLIVDTINEILKAEDLNDHKKSLEDVAKLAEVAKDDLMGTYKFMTNEAIHRRLAIRRQATNRIRDADVKTRLINGPFDYSEIFSMDSIEKTEKALHQPAPRTINLHKPAQDLKVSQI